MLVKKKEMKKKCLTSYGNEMEMKRKEREREKKMRITEYLMNEVEVKWGKKGIAIRDVFESFSISNEMLKLQDPSILYDKWR